ncbi:F-box and leucine-rich repeat protein 13 [Sarotherodon galilaeus]
MSFSLCKALLLRVHVSPKLIRKIQLSTVPESVKQLQDELQATLGLEGDFAIQYEDPDFGNALCNLMDINELPAGRAVLHLIWEENASASPPQTPSDHSAISSIDTASVSSASSFSPSSSTQTYMRSTSQWPNPFPIPTFSYDIELKLRKGNEVYERAGANLSVTRDIKMEVLDKLAQEMFAIKAYPDKNEIRSVAQELVSKHPCLNEPGNGTGYDGWATSIKFKLGNYRSKLNQAGCSEVAVNRKRRGEEDDSGSNRFSLKKPKRGEVNFIPDAPENYNDESLENERCILEDEMKKRDKNMALVTQKMDITFSLRRKEVVEMQPLVKEMQLRWPALFLKEQVSNIVQHRRTISLEGLPIFVHDDETKLFLTCLDTDPVERVTQGVTVGILTVLEDYVGPNSQTTVVNTAIVLEEDIILDDLPDLPTAFAYLFGLLYGLNMEFPKELKYTFEAVQHIFMELTSTCSQRIRSFKTKLLTKV